jgi:hypothetical protein
MKSEGAILAWTQLRLVARTLAETAATQRNTMAHCETMAWLPTKKNNPDLVATTSNTYTLDALVHVHELLHAS